MSVYTKVKSYLDLFKRALLGQEHEFTKGSIDRAIFLLAIPMILEMAMESVFAVVDVYFVSRLNDNDAVATIGLTESVLTLIYSLAIGLSMGATAMVARRVGEKDIRGAEVAATRVALSAYVTVAIDEVAKIRLHNHIFDFIVKLLIHQSGQYFFLVTNLTRFSSENMERNTTIERV